MNKKIYKATALVFILSLVAKCIGFIKSIVEASVYGVSEEMDIFNVTSGFVSNVLYMITTAIAVVFIPLYIQHEKKNNVRKRFASITITSLLLLSVLVIIMLALLAPIIVRIVAPYLTEDKYSIAAMYFRILIVGIAFSLMANMYSSVLNAEKRFGLSTLTSLINSVVLIVFIIAFSKSMGVMALVVAMPISFLIQWIVLYLLGHAYARITLEYGLKDDAIRLLVIQATPVLLCQATVEINQVVDRALLTGVEVGALTAVSYSAVLYQFVTTVVSTPISTVMFTELSESGSKKNNERMKSLILESFRLIVIICIPIVCITVLDSIDIVRIVYGHGRFHDNAIYQCSDGLKMYIICLLPVCIKSVLSRAYYSLNDTKRPMIYGIFEVALNIGLSVLLVRKYGILGVVGATAIASFVFIIVMIIDFNLKYIKIIEKEDVFSYWKVAVSGMVSMVVIVAVKTISVSSSLVEFVVDTTAFFFIYSIMLVILRESSIKQLLDSIIKRMNRK